MVRLQPLAALGGGGDGCGGEGGLGSRSPPAGPGRDAPDLKGFEHRRLPGGIAMVRALRPKQPSMRVLEVQGSFREERHQPSPVRRANSADPPEGSDLHTAEAHWRSVQLYLAKNAFTARDSFREIDTTHTGLISEEEYCLWLKNQVGISGRHGKPERHAVWAYLVAAADPAKPPSEEEHHDLGVPAALDTILTAEAYCLAVSRRCHAGHFDDDGEYDDYDVGH